MNSRCEDNKDMEYEKMQMPMMSMAGCMNEMMMPNMGMMCMMPNMMMNPMMCGMPMMYAPMSEIEDEYDEDDSDYSDDEDDCMRKYKPGDVRKILQKIQRYNPGVFRMLRMYGVPYPEARRIVRRIIRLTLMYYDD